MRGPIQAESGVHALDYRDKFWDNYWRDSKSSTSDILDAVESEENQKEVEVINQNQNIEVI